LREYLNRLIGWQAEGWGHSLLRDIFRGLPALAWAPLPLFWLARALGTSSQYCAASHLSKNI
jgi:hypothetical protein